MTDVKPALTAEEWEYALVRKDGLPEYAVFWLEGGARYRPNAPQGAAALCLYGQPYGFTWEDVGWINSMLTAWAGDPFNMDGSATEEERDRRMREWLEQRDAWLRGLADRIKALLPPRESR